MLTTDCVCRILRGTTKSASPISFTRSSTATQSFWKRNRTRSSWAFASSSNLSHFATAPPRDFNQVMAPVLCITSSSPTFGFCLPIISGRQMCAPCTRTNSRFCRIAPFVQSSRFLRIRFSCRCQAYPSISAHFFIVVKSGAALTPVLTSHFSHLDERLTSSIQTLFHPMSVYCFFSWLTHKLVFIYTLGLIRRFAMASSSPTTSIPIQEPVFLQFLQ